MILLDYSAVAIANISKGLKIDKEQLTKEFALHMILNSIRASNVKFKKDYGTMVICCDYRHNWRKDEFKYYKYKRRKNRKDDDIDWDFIYECLDHVKEEITVGFPYNVIEIENAEADDVIGALALYATEQKKPSVIVSNDKDFIQRHSEYVCQYRPCESAFVRHHQPHIFLKELIIRGDADDGIPNIKSADNHFAVEGGPKQKSIFQRDLDVWLEDETNSFLDADEVMKNNFERNKKLIDLNFTPDDIKEKAIELYNSGRRVANKAEMTKFFMKNRLRMLHERMSDFV